MFVVIRSSFSDPSFLVDHTNGGAYTTMLRPSVICLSVVCKYVLCSVRSGAKVTIDRL